MAGGRPRKFKSVEELEEKINKYFGSITITEPLTKSVIVGYKNDDKEKPICKEIPVVNNNGEQVFIDKYFKNPTIGDMCIFLDITRDTLLNYEKLPEYLGTIKKAKGRIEAFLEQELYREKGHTGLIFNLKNNFGWKDKQEVESTVTAKVEMSQEEKEKKLKALKERLDDVYGD